MKVSHAAAAVDVAFTYLALHAMPRGMERREFLKAAEAMVGTVETQAPRGSTEVVLTEAQRKRVLDETGVELESTDW